jgi:hypothetical protein
MDKHDRPYKCHEPGCDKVQGFTYSGGLLRHQREVHKKNKSSGRDLYCQYPTCNRSNSQPFTRKENLIEHIRRRHVPEGAPASHALQSGFATPAAPVKPQDSPRKRKRIPSSEFEDELQFLKEESDEQENLDQVKRLRRTIAVKDRTIALRDDTIRRLETELTVSREEVSRFKSMLGT